MFLWSRGAVTPMFNFVFLIIAVLVNSSSIFAMERQLDDAAQTAEESTKSYFQTSVVPNELWVNIILDVDSDPTILFQALMKLSEVDRNLRRHFSHEQIADLLLIGSFYPVDNVPKESLLRRLVRKNQQAFLAVLLQKARTKTSVVDWTSLRHASQIFWRFIYDDINGYRLPDNAVRLASELGRVECLEIPR